MAGMLQLTHRVLPALLWCLALLPAGPAYSLDDALWRDAQTAIARGIDYLRSTQNADGSWSPQPGPAVTALVLGVMLDQGDMQADDPAVARALDRVLASAGPDGGLHDGILQNYNTAICLSTLARLNHRPDVADVIARGEQYLRSLQWLGQDDPFGVPTEAEHPFHGGAGYGQHGRPDGSNTQMFAQALYDMGVDCDDPAFVGAVAFFTRLQGVPQNDLLADQIVLDGGAIYATSLDKAHIGMPESKAGAYVDEQGVSRLRTYGSMTYAMFKTYVYAQLEPGDPRVTAAWEWIGRNYTVEHNPGMPEAQKQQGYYYYLVTMARALEAWGQPTLIDAGGGVHRWRQDSVRHLLRLQRPDGSWVNEADRWMEGDANLVTAYALIALTVAAR
jgi:squalene-hopene/tetraprenyl-beta-curcumene cyclase